MKNQQVEVRLDEEDKKFIEAIKQMRLWYYQPWMLLSSFFYLGGFIAISWAWFIPMNDRCSGYLTTHCADFYFLMGLYHILMGVMVERRLKFGFATLVIDILVDINTHLHKKR